MSGGVLGTSRIDADSAGDLLWFLCGWTMKDDPVEEPFAAALQATSAELGVIIPPSIPMILFGVASRSMPPLSWAAAGVARAVRPAFSPVDGEVTEVHSALVQNPEAVNKDPHGSWMIALKLADNPDADDLLDAGQYTELTQ